MREGSVVARRRSRVEGPNKLRRKLRRIEPAITRELQDVVRDGLNRIQRDAMSLAPVDQGDLRESIEVNLSRDKLSGLVGPGAKAAELVRRTTGSEFGRTVKRGKRRGQKYNMRRATKEALFNFYKGYWAEFGTKGNAKKNIPAQPARPFMGPAYEINKGWIARKASASIDSILAKVSRG